MSTHSILQSQYLAALAMLGDAIEKCPETLWDRPADQNRFWQAAYHALFYTHLYLQPSEKDFSPWDKNRPGSHRMETTGEPYSKAEVLEYFEFCQQVVKAQVPALELEAPSGFHWLPFNKLELQLYNIRHIQQHCGELFERLSAAGGIEVHWVGTVS